MLYNILINITAVNMVQVSSISNTTPSNRQLRVSEGHNYDYFSTYTTTNNIVYVKYTASYHYITATQESSLYTAIDTALLNAVHSGRFTTQLAQYGTANHIPGLVYTTTSSLTITSLSYYNTTTATAASDITVIPLTIIIAASAALGGVIILTLLICLISWYRSICCFKPSRNLEAKNTQASSKVTPSASEYTMKRQSSTITAGTYNSSPTSSRFRTLLRRQPESDDIGLIYMQHERDNDDISGGDDMVGVAHPWVKVILRLHDGYMTYINLESTHTQTISLLDHSVTTEQDERSSTINRISGHNYDPREYSTLLVWSPTDRYSFCIRDEGSSWVQHAGVMIYSNQYTLQQWCQCFIKHIKVANECPTPRHFIFAPRPADGYTEGMYALV